ncbi:MAG: PAS domain-containing protein, partial [Rubrivivax sp.]
MASPREAASWFGPPESMLPGWRPALGAAESTGFVRLWRGFMAVRLFAGLVLLLLQGVIVALGQPVPVWLFMLAIGYVLVALLVRLKNRPVLPLRALDLNWVATVGADVAYFSVLQLEQTGGIAYTPLFALPVLLAAVLGTVQLALGTAAIATLLLLADAWWVSIVLAADAPGRFLQAGLTGTGLFIVAVLANQLAVRLAREERRSLESQRAERMQALVNELVIDNISDGVLVVDRLGLVHAVNPVARQLLGADPALVLPPFSLRREPAWHGLADLAFIAFEQRQRAEVDVGIDRPGAAPVRLHVRTRMTAQVGQAEDASLCVFFLQDMREMEARVRTEKLAAMGRMSAAVAHEIRNPLAAISQANDLLEEDLADPGLIRLTAMVRQNAQRLARIVDDILEVARAQQQPLLPWLPEPGMRLDAQVRTASGEWAAQTGHG